MKKERDLFGAIVLSGIALVGGCAEPTPDRTDASPSVDAARADTGAMVADASSAEDAATSPDAATGGDADMPDEDAGMVLIL